jgi:ribosomal protein L17
MRHGKKIHRLGRPADQRKALLRALTTQLLTHGAIKTTKQKARAVRPWVDKMIVLAKEGSDAKKKQVRNSLHGGHNERNRAPDTTHAGPLLPRQTDVAPVCSRRTRGCMIRRSLTACSRKRRSATQPA